MRLIDANKLKSKFEINFSKKPEAQAIYQHLIDIVEDMPTEYKEPNMTNTEFINALEKQLEDMASDYKALGSKREQLAMDMNKIRFLIDKLKEETDGQ